MMDQLLQHITSLREQGEKVALITITDSTGSVPASVGQMMAVTADGGSCGTVGGGAAEHALKQRAVEAMRRGESFFSFSFELSQQNMVCGGGISGFGTVFGVAPHMVLFGGGHVAQNIAPIAERLGFDITVVESRIEMKPYFSCAVRFICCPADEYPNKIPLDENMYVVICTHGHRSDGEALAFCGKAKVAYLGMIGSRQKIKALAEELPLDNILNLYAPIGLDVASGAPGEIAVAIMAEILLIKNKGTLRHKKNF